MNLGLAALRFFFLFLFSSSKSSAPAWLSAKATILVSPTVGSGEYSSVSVSETWSSMTGSLQRGKNISDKKKEKYQSSLPIAKAIISDQYGFKLDRRVFKLIQYNINQIGDENKEKYQFGNKLIKY
ncbi:hypothetical protein pdam_00007678, partial [Pocillopora damicornis]